MKKSLIALLVILIIIVIAGVGFVAYKMGEDKGKEDKQAMNENNTINTIGDETENTNSINNNQIVNRNIEEELIAFIKSTEKFASERELREYEAIVKENGGDTIASDDIVNVESYTPIYVLTRRINMGSETDIAYILVKDNDGMQKILEVDTRNVTSTTEIVSCVQNSPTSITISTFTNNVESGTTYNTKYSFAKEYGIWKEKDKNTY